MALANQQLLIGNKSGSNWVNVGRHKEYLTSGYMCFFALIFVPRCFQILKTAESKRMCQLPDQGVCFGLILLPFWDETWLLIPSVPSMSRKVRWMGWRGCWGLQPALCLGRSGGTDHRRWLWAYWSTAEYCRFVLQKSLSLQILLHRLSYATNYM